jgi:hypothetical protein
MLCGAVGTILAVTRVAAKSSLTLAWALWRVWSRLPPRQRRMVLTAARRHGPRIASRAATSAAATARRRVQRAARP